jgi:hypothetical protein
MIPILLIHGYSAEGPGNTPSDYQNIYGRLRQRLHDFYGDRPVFELDLGRYISLDDGVTLDDVAEALDFALRSGFAQLLASPAGFNVIIHSTGALVIRNWLRLYSPKPSPVKRIIHLAGANFGSGWAHIGRAELAKWYRAVVENADRGVQILNALELGASATLDLHLHFLDPENDMLRDYRIFEFVIIGSQPVDAWYKIPVRYAIEDGSDGVVRVSGSNLNFQYVRIAPTDAALAMGWDAIRQESEFYVHSESAENLGSHYELVSLSVPLGFSGTIDIDPDCLRPQIPLAIPYGCAHTGDATGVINGVRTIDEVMDLVKMALDVNSEADWNDVQRRYADATAATYERVKIDNKPGVFQFLSDPRKQYDPHAQIIIRVRDQHGAPVDKYQLYFDSVQSSEDTPIRKLMEDTHENNCSHHVRTYYFRTSCFDKDLDAWVPQAPRVRGTYVEISALEPNSKEIAFLPLRLWLTTEQLTLWLGEHRTTIVDVTLIRRSSTRVFSIMPD